jgi:hypothetical protein
MFARLSRFSVRSRAPVSGDTRRHMVLQKKGEPLAGNLTPDANGIPLRGYEHALEGKA